MAHSICQHCSGGVQVPACVADAIRDHLLFNNAQLGAGHELSKRSTAVVEKAHQVIKVINQSHYNHAPGVPLTANTAHGKHQVHTLLAAARLSAGQKTPSTTILS